MDLSSRKLPQVLQKVDGSPVRTYQDWEENAPALLTCIEQEEYGKLPDIPVTCTYEVTYHDENSFHAGRSTVQTVKVTCTSGEDTSEWSFQVALPKANQPVPVFIHIDFNPHYPVDTTPVEEICGRGYGYAMLRYDHVTSDDGDFTDGVARLFYPDGVRGEHDGGKIAIWAWALQRVMDYLETDPRVDKTKVVPVGHSRLGKTAIWAAVKDKRFWGTVSNASGCSGASLARGNTGEQTWQIVERFDFWFAPAYAKYNHHPELLPFDQHQVIALMAPRYVYVMSGSEDSWADPVSEHAACEAASPVWELYGRHGFEPVEESVIGKDFVSNAGDVGYQRRPGTHFFGRTGWLRLMDFFDGKR